MREKPSRHTPRGREKARKPRAKHAHATGKRGQKPQGEPAGKKRAGVRLLLGDHDAARRSLARILGDLHRRQKDGSVTERDIKAARAEGYLLGTLLRYFEHAVEVGTLDELRGEVERLKREAKP